jgi:hypothetical protein
MWYCAEEPSTQEERECVCEREREREESLEANLIGYIA